MCSSCVFHVVSVKYYWSVCFIHLCIQVKYCDFSVSYLFGFVGVFVGGFALRHMSHKDDVPCTRAGVTHSAGMDTAVAVVLFQTRDGLHKYTMGSTDDPFHLRHAY